MSEETSTREHDTDFEVLLEQDVTGVPVIVLADEIQGEEWALTVEQARSIGTRLIEAADQAEGKQAEPEQIDWEPVPGRPVAVLREKAEP